MDDSVKILVPLAALSVFLDGSQTGAGQATKSGLQSATDSWSLAQFT